MKLIIVESPTKARTISRFLDKSYKVLSSFGHVRDLPRGKLGVDTKKDFSPEYTIPEKAKKAIKELEDISKKADEIILATDEDREGEAIAYHLKHILSKKKKLKFKRITFHEITPKAIEEALKNPRGIDMNLFDAQQARRILDRLVGYELSPFLWRKIRKGLSAGRVQSVAVRIIVEREREREKFKPEEYWKIKALWTKGNNKKKPEVETLKEGDKKKQEEIMKKKDKLNGVFAILNKENGKKIAKHDIKTGKEVKKILGGIKKEKLVVEDIEKKKSLRNPAPPFRTSTLQQEAAGKLGFSAKRTMMAAQRLYEGVKVNGRRLGLITYMRTDSLYVSPVALNSIRGLIQKSFGDKYLPPSPRFFKKKAKGAQEAHEAIRPTFPTKTPDELRSFLKPDQYKLYRLIWNKTIASQMTPAVVNVVNVIFKAGKYGLLSKGSQIKFDGFLKVMGTKALREEKLPGLTVGEEVENHLISGEQDFTKPPARYSEATLIKALEEHGIGRPSTYAPTISTIQEREYIAKDENSFLFPQEIGFIVNDLLTKHFPDIVEIEFTAEVEEDLDEIARGKKKWIPIIKNFYSPFKKNLKKKEETVKKIEKVVKGKKCPLCKKPLLEKFGRFGKFYACKGYPECKYTEANEEEQKLNREIKKEKCPKCGSPLELKSSKWGMFVGCSNYPNCKFTKKVEKKVGIKCPQCKKGEIIVKKGKRGPFYACNQFPNCKYIAKGTPAKKKCPKCKQTMMKVRGEEICLNRACNK